MQVYMCLFMYTQFTHKTAVYVIEYGLNQKRKVRTHDDDDPHHEKKSYFRLEENVTRWASNIKSRGVLFSTTMLTFSFPKISQSAAQSP